AYWFDWDDTTNSGWTSFVPSGTSGSATKQWTSPGTYQVTAKAKDINGGESGFSAPLTVVISSGPALDIGTITGGLFKVSVPIENTGSAAATNVQWTIDLVGGAFIGGSSSGTEPSIAAAGSVTVQSGLIIGFGATTVTATATCDEGSSDTRSQTGFVLLIFIIVNAGGGI
ncbi:MAG: Zn-dependent exopeptidase M28, partial [Thermoplasmatales archaeon]|nr:Zn-dependent exopeptidase M28 [Thermoplasmatales archaeon]